MYINSKRTKACTSVLNQIHEEDAFAHKREMHISLTTKLQKHFSGMHPCRNLQEAL
jgi:hypothetical protein